MPIKILYLITKDDVGGAQKYVNELAEGLNKEKFITEILHGGKKGARFLSNAYHPYFLFANDILALIELIITLRRKKPDILHLNSSKAGVIGAISARLAGVPKVVFTAHGWVFNPDSALSKARKDFYAFLHRLAARFQHHIINVSEYDKQLAIKGSIATSSKLITIRNGLDLEKIKFLDKKTARKALSKLVSQFPNFSTSNNEIWIGSVGRLVGEKNYSDFVKAASLIKNPNAKFFIIGSGEQKKQLQSLIASCGLLGRFFIIENIAPAAPYIKAFDIFALSSTKEGLPYTLLEAMAAELPTVATRVGGIAEVLIPPNKLKGGLVMPPGEPEELARAISHLLENPQEAKRLAGEAKKFLKQNLTLSRVLKETEKVYIS